MTAHVPAAIRAEMTVHVPAAIRAAEMTAHAPAVSREEVPLHRALPAEDSRRSRCRNSRIPSRTATTIRARRAAVSTAGYTKFFLKK